jgi:hypothetical protein
MTQKTGFGMKKDIYQKVVALSKHHINNCDWLNSKPMSLVFNRRVIRYYVAKSDFV